MPPMTTTFCVVSLLLCLGALLELGHGLKCKYRARTEIETRQEIRDFECRKTEDGTDFHYCYAAYCTTGELIFDMWNCVTIFDIESCRAMAANDSKNYHPNHPDADLWNCNCKYGEWGVDNDNEKFAVRPIKVTTTTTTTTKTTTTTTAPNSATDPPMSSTADYLVGSTESPIESQSPMDSTKSAMNASVVPEIPADVFVEADCPEEICGEA